MEFMRSFRTRHFARKPVVVSPQNVGCWCPSDGTAKKSFFFFFFLKIGFARRKLHDIAGILVGYAMLGGALRDDTKNGCVADYRNTDRFAFYVSIQSSINLNISPNISHRHESWRGLFISGIYLLTASYHHFRWRGSENQQ